MTNKQMLAAIGYILVTCDIAPTPAGHLYASLMGQGVNLEQYSLIENALRVDGDITVSAYLVTLTDQGRAKAKLIRSEIGV